MNKEVKKEKKELSRDFINLKKQIENHKSDTTKKDMAEILISRHTEDLSKNIFDIAEGNVKDILEKNTATRSIISQEVGIGKQHADHYLHDLLISHENIVRIKLPVKNENGKHEVYTWLDIEKANGYTLDIAKGYYNEYEAMNEQDKLSKQRLEAIKL